MTHLPLRCFALVLTRLTSYRATPEVLWGTLHGLVGLGFAVWWQATVQIAAAMAKIAKSQ